MPRSSCAHPFVRMTAVKRILAATALLAATAATAVAVLPHLSVVFPIRHIETVKAPAETAPPQDVSTAIPPTDTVTTNAVAQTANPGTPETFRQLREGLEALREDRFDEARAIRNSIAPRSLDNHILTWALAYFGGDRLPSAEIAAAARRLPGWPGMERLRDNSERAMMRENPSPGAVIAAFGDTIPQTYQGAVTLARALTATGDRAKAAAVFAPFWHETKLEASDEAAALVEFAQVLGPADHRRRMEYMLYENRTKSAERLAQAAQAPKLAQAWIAVLRKQKNAAALLDGVPEAERTAGYVFAKARQFRAGEKLREAADEMAKVPRQADALVNADAWWVERRLLARKLLDIGDTKRAYEVAAGHAAQSPALAAEAEFHAGWIALRGLNDAAKASAHFERILKIADGPILRARAHYWLGRAAEKSGTGDMRAHYSEAAKYGTAFYGQLASAKLGAKTVAIADPLPAAGEQERFAAREAVQAIRRLEEAGHGWRANVLYLALAEELPSVGELSLLADMAENRGDHYVALKIGKVAANRGLDVGALSHPVGAIPDEADVSAAGKALAYAIARQESEFNPGAVSPAGARGLLQLMPGTAKSVADRSGLAYSQERLTSDAAYNATLGSQFLQEQLEGFDGSYILTFAAYNAGPSRAREWIERYGDPRGKRIEEVVDWIERIPFTETRAYVQRVMENYQVYKMRLTGAVDIEGDLRRGR